MAATRRGWTNRRHLDRLREISSRITLACTNCLPVRPVPLHHQGGSTPVEVRHPWGHFLRVPTEGGCS
jgi:hypothetical protein